MRGYRDYKETLTRFEQLLLRKFGDNLISIVLYGSVARGTAKEEATENRNIFLDMIDDSIILYDKDNFFKNRLKELKNRLTQLGSRKVTLKDKTWYWQLKPDIKAGEILEL